jgi:hypothetical protein
MPRQAVGNIMLHVRGNSNRNRMQTLQHAAELHRWQYYLVRVVLTRFQHAMWIVMVQLLRGSLAVGREGADDGAAVHTSLHGSTGRTEVFIKHTPVRCIACMVPLSLAMCHA